VAVTVYSPLSETGEFRIAVKPPAESEVTDVGVMPGAAPPQVTVTAELLAKSLPEMVASPAPLEGVSVTAAGAAGVVTALRARDVTENPEYAALSVAAAPPMVKVTVLPPHEPEEELSSSVRSYCPPDTAAVAVAVAVAQLAEATTAVPSAALAESKVTAP